MPVFIALLRAINVGKSGHLPMSELRRLCEDAGFTHVTTYIQSGNVVLTSRLGATKVQQILESALERKMGRPAAVHLRTPAQLADVVKSSPFPDAPPQKVLVFFLERPLPKDALAGLKVPGHEEVRPSGREVHVHYPDGQGQSKLKLPFANESTGRNLNTVRKLLELSGGSDL